MDAEKNPDAKPAMSARRQDEVLAGIDDPFARRSLRVAYHLRRYSVIYVVGALAVLAVAILPTMGDGSDSVASGNGASTGGAYGGQPGASATSAPGVAGLPGAG